MCANVCMYDDIIFIYQEDYKLSDNIFLIDRSLVQLS